MTPEIEPYCACERTFLDEDLQDTAGTGRKPRWVVSIEHDGRPTRATVADWNAGPTVPLRERALDTAKAAQTLREDAGPRQLAELTAWLTQHHPEYTWPVFESAAQARRCTASLANYAVARTPLWQPRFEMKFGADLPPGGALPYAIAMIELTRDECRKHLGKLPPAVMADAAKRSTSHPTFRKAWQRHEQRRADAAERAREEALSLNSLIGEMDALQAQISVLTAQHAKVATSTGAALPPVLVEAIGRMAQPSIEAGEIVSIGKALLSELKRSDEPSMRDATLLAAIEQMGQRLVERLGEAMAEVANPPKQIRHVDINRHNGQVTITTEIP